MERFVLKSLFISTFPSWRTKPLRSQYGRLLNLFKEHVVGFMGGIMRALCKLCMSEFLHWCGRHSALFGWGPWRHAWVALVIIHHLVRCLKCGQLSLGSPQALLLKASRRWHCIPKGLPMTGREGVPCHACNRVIISHAYLSIILVVLPTIEKGKNIAFTYGEPTFALN